MIAWRLKKAREHLGWSQSKLARLTGVPQSAISALEAAQRDVVTTDTAKRLARALGVGVDYLIGTWDDDAVAAPAAADTLPSAPRGPGRPRKVVRAPAS